jgi:shikimate kinase
MERNIILIGMPGVGKSSIGVVLAKVMGMAFIDSDIVIQQQTGRTLKELIRELGTDGFLALEDRINTGIDAKNAVIATGGSAVFGENAMRHFKETGIIVYLAADYENLMGRFSDLDDRGVVHEEGQTLKDVYDARCRLYEKFADVTVRQNEPELRIDEAIREIVGSLSES